MFHTTLQHDFECCGIGTDGYKEWSKNEYFNCTRNTADNPSVERWSPPCDRRTVTLNSGVAFHIPAAARTPMKSTRTWSTLCVVLECSIRQEHPGMLEKFGLSLDNELQDLARGGRGRGSVEDQHARLYPKNSNSHREQPLSCGGSCHRSGS